MQLLADCRQLFKDCSYFTPTELHNRLFESEDWPWGEWYQGKPITKRRVGDILRKFGIRSHTKRDKEFTGRAYWKEDFAPVFDRYLPDTRLHCDTTQ
ncbi:MAG: DUF3631 domain-containing protein [Gammaproteobacteria bacterium]|nr:DUF3631 domain-containing protein [Gammaproteobacteria bacterium]